MKRPDRLYRPSRTIEDIRRTTSYFRAGDVPFSPFTRIGQLVKPEEEPTAAIVPKQPHRLPKPPVFPAGFSLQLDRQRTEGPTGHTAQAQPKRVASFTSLASQVAAGGTLLKQLTYRIAGVGRTLAAAGTSLLWRLRHSPWLHHKYIADVGVRLTLAKRTHEAMKWAAPGIAILVLLLLTVLLRPTGRPSKRHPGSSQPATSQHAAQQATAAATKQPGKGAGTNGTPPGASGPENTPISSGSIGTANTSSPSGTVSGGRGSLIGGMGGGPTSPTGTTSGATSSTGGTAGSGSGGIPGVTSPYPVTVPGQSVQLGGKQIVGTDPIGVTLN